MEDFLRFVSKIELVLLFLLPIICVFLFGVFGYDLTDNSYMRGYAYSMLNGKKLYQDLFSRLPPGGFLLQKWFYGIVGEFYPIFINRLLFYFNNALMSLLMLLVIKKHRLMNKKINWTLLFVLLYFISINNYPVSMGYAHVSLALGAISFFLGLLNMFTTSGVILGLALCTKQTFAGLFFLIPIYIYLKKLHWNAYVKFILSALITSAVIFYSFQSELVHFYKMSLRHTFGAIFRSGFKTYFHFSSLAEVAAALSIFALLRYSKINKNIRRLAYAAIFSVFIFMTKNYFKSGIYFALHDTYKILFLLSVLFLGNDLLGFFKKKELPDLRTSVFFILVLLCWISGLSDSATGPVYFAPLLVICLYYLTENRSDQNQIIKELLIFTSLIYVAMNLNSYRDGSRLKMNKHLGDIDQRYSFIYTNERKFEKVMELINLHKKYGRIIVLPTFSDANFLLRQVNCLPTVWDVATGLSTPRESLILKMKNSIAQCSKDHTFLIEKGVTQRFTLYTPIVLKTFQKVGETNYFEIYQR